MRGPIDFAFQIRFEKRLNDTLLPYRNSHDLTIRRRLTGLGAACLLGFGAANVYAAVSDDMQVASMVDAHEATLEQEIVGDILSNSLNAVGGIIGLGGAVEVVAYMGATRRRQLEWQPVYEALNREQ